MRQPEHEVIHEPVSEKLWARAKEENGIETIALILAFEAGRAAASETLLKANERKTHDAALDIILEAGQFVEATE